MPISTTISDATSMFALMQTSDTTDLSQSYTITQDIDMGALICTSIGISNSNGFTGSLSGILQSSGKYPTITIRNIASTYSGFFDYINSSNTIQNINISYNFSSNTTLTAPNDIGGFASDIGNGSNLPDINNCTVKFISNNCSINSLSSSFTSNCGGFIGSLQSGIISNCSVISNDNFSISGINLGFFAGNIALAPSISISISSCTIIVGNNCSLIGQNLGTNAIGGICGLVQNNINNCKIFVKDNCNFSVTNTSSTAGGLFGYITSFISDAVNVNYCYGIYGNNTSINTSNPTANVGGLCGQVDNKANLQNSLIIYGNNTILISTSYRAGGVIGTVGIGGTTANCIAIFKDYNITGNNSSIEGPTIGVSTFATSVTNILSQTYGIPVSGSGVTTVSTTSQTNIYNTIQTNYSADMQWLISLIRIREPLNNPTPNNTVNLDSIMQITDNKILQLYKNNAIILSMYYSNTPYISSTFGTIKRYLDSFVVIPDSDIVYYIVAVGTQYILEATKQYYLPTDNINITIVSSGELFNNIVTNNTELYYNSNTYIKGNTINNTVYIIGIGTLCVKINEIIQESANIQVTNICQKSITTNTDSSIIPEQKASNIIRENATIKMAQPDIYIQRGIKKPVFQSYQFQMMYLQGKACGR